MFHRRVQGTGVHRIAFWRSADRMADGYRVRRTAGYIFPCVRRTKYSPLHTGHMVHDIVRYIESAHKQPLFCQQFIALVALKSARNAKNPPTNEVINTHFELGEARNFAMKTSSD